MEEGRGKVIEGMAGTGQDMGWDREGRERERRKGGKGRRGATAPRLQFLAPPLHERRQSTRFAPDLDPHFVNPGSAPVIVIVLPAFDFSVSAIFFARRRQRMFSTCGGENLLFDFDSTAVRLRIKRRESHRARSIKVPGLSGPV